MVPDDPFRSNPEYRSNGPGGHVIQLEPMDTATYEAWRAESIREYAQEKIEAGTWPEAEALERSAKSYVELLPGVLATPGHELRSMVNDEGERVGYAWFAPEDRPSGRVVFTYDIAVYPAHRRKGYAQQALSEIERYARDNGCYGVQLHVHGANTGARELYRNAGFVETDVTMLKRVDD
jgi:ribosomal protein S18 acetylase RimI-like enzyme